MVGEAAGVGVFEEGAVWGALAEEVLINRAGVFVADSFCH